jgi:putative salt-induced outer membrane protein YdiY
LAVLRKFERLLLTSLFAFSSLSFADQVTLKNGDRITGTVVKSDGKTLTLHTDAGGDLTLKMDAIQEIKTDQDLHVTTKSGQTIVGPVTTSDGKLDVATKSGGTVQAPIPDVTLIRNDAEQAAYEKTLHPKLTQGWTGGANVGFSIARGNSQTENLALAFNAARPTLPDKIVLYATSINTTNSLAPPGFTTVASLATGGLRYERNLTPRVFAFGAADYMANALQFLDLRQVYSGGFGYHVIENDQTKLDLFGGVNYTHETYSNGTVLVPATPTSPAIYSSYGVTNRFVALTLGESLDQKLGKTTELVQNLTFYPNLQDTGEYRIVFNLGTVTKINKWFGWTNQFGDIYVSNPPAGAKKNDVIFTTGLNIAFAH